MKWSYLLGFLAFGLFSFGSTAFASQLSVSGSNTPQSSVFFSFGYSGNTHNMYLVFNASGSEVAWLNNQTGGTFTSSTLNTLGIVTSTLPDGNYSMIAMNTNDTISPNTLAQANSNTWCNVSTCSLSDIQAYWGGLPPDQDDGAWKVSEVDFIINSGTPPPPPDPTSTIATSTYYHDQYIYEDYVSDFIWGLIAATITAPFFMINAMRQRKRSTNNKTT